MATPAPYLVKSAATGRYINRILVDSASPPTIPGATIEVETAQNAAQAAIDFAQNIADAKTAMQPGLRDTAMQAFRNDPSTTAKVIRAVALVTLDQINTLRTKAGLATFTAADLFDAIVAKINIGSAD